METMNDKIRNLQRAIDAEKEIMANCNHQWGEVFSNPETQKEEYFTGKYETQGVHLWPITEYRNKIVPRWTRKCTICGLKEHTYKQKPSGYEADF